MRGCWWDDFPASPQYSPPHAPHAVPQGVELPILIEPRGAMTADADEDVAVARKAHASHVNATMLPYSSRPVCHVAIAL